jgi:predicted phosphodiesterase
MKIPQLGDLIESENLQDELDDLIIKLPSTRKGPDVYPDIVELPFIPKKLVALPDSHHSIQDQKAIDLTIKFLQDYEPDAIVLLGDVYDCVCLSRHDSSHTAERLMDIKYKMASEIEAAKPFLNELLNICDDVVLIEGNHERRRKNMINQNPGLLGHPGLEPKKFFEIPDQITWINNNQRLKVGNAYFEHGDGIINSRGSQHIAAALGQRRPWCNTFVAHWHCSSEYNRVAYWPDGTPETFITATCGHLSTVKEQSFVNLPNWTLGFRTVEFWQDGSTDKNSVKFSTHQINFINYKFSWNGKMYK